MESEIMSKYRRIQQTIFAMRGHELLAFSCTGHELLGDTRQHLISRQMVGYTQSYVHRCSMYQ